MRHVLCQIALALTLGLPAQAQDWALGGFDAVGLSHGGAPVAGRSDIVTMWRGRLWHFATEENRARFEADPRAFLPRFDGFCPVSIAEARPEPGDPRFAVIVNGQLYLTRSARAQRRLQEAPAEVLDRAEANWQGR